MDWLRTLIFLVLVPGTVLFYIPIEIASSTGEIQDTGKQLLVFRKQSDGKWLVSTGIFNSDLAVAHGAVGPHNLRGIPAPSERSWHWADGRALLLGHSAGSRCFLA